MPARTVIGSHCGGRGRVPILIVCNVRGSICIAGKNDELVTNRCSVLIERSSCRGHGSEWLDIGAENFSIAMCT